MSGRRSGAHTSRYRFLTASKAPAWCAKRRQASRWFARGRAASAAGGLTFLEPLGQVDHVGVVAGRVERHDAGFLRARRLELSREKRGRQADGGDDSGGRRGGSGGSGGTLKSAAQRSRGQYARGRERRVGREAH